MGIFLLMQVEMAGRGNSWEGIIDCSFLSTVEKAPEAEEPSTDGILGRVPPRPIPPRGRPLALRLLLGGACPRPQERQLPLHEAVQLLVRLLLPHGHHLLRPRPRRGQEGPQDAQRSRWGGAFIIGLSSMKEADVGNERLPCV